jgi:quinol-cytochrome oxidoreductase complex cytochrome b subunit
LAGVCLTIQIVTGLFLTMHYTPHIDYAFLSVEHIMRDVNYGWLMRYFHANGSSAFFAIVYIHMARGIYYGSYTSPREVLWYSGVVMFVLMMAIGFLGYCLPWGQMSFWGATVITNLFSAVPFMGTYIVEFLWGGFTVANSTLNRFYTLHFLLPFVLVGLVIVHLFLLHLAGSNNPLGSGVERNNIPFYPYFYVKDLLGLMVFILLLGILVFFYPNSLGHSDNYIPANPLVTPTHIVPEWYFLPFYAILRSIPNKVVGVIAMFGAVLIIGLLPKLNIDEIRSNSFKTIGAVLYWLFMFNFVLLFWVGQLPPEEPYVFLSQICTFNYFLYFVILYYVNLLELFLLKVSVFRN